MRGGAGRTPGVVKNQRVVGDDVEGSACVGMHLRNGIRGQSRWRWTWTSETCCSQIQNWRSARHDRTREWHIASSSSFRTAYHSVAGGWLMVRRELQYTEPRDLQGNLQAEKHEVMCRMPGASFQSTHFCRHLAGRHAFLSPTQALSIMQPGWQASNYGANTCDRCRALSSASLLS